MRRRFVKAQVAALALLLAACLLLAGTAYREMAEPAAATSTPAAPVAAEPAIPPSPRFTLAPIERFSETARRPLFSETRRPPPPAQAADQTSFAIAGIVLSADQRGAILVHGAPPILTRVAEGQEIDGWTVQSIDAEHVVLARGAAEQQLKLVDKPKTARPRPSHP